MKAGRPITDTWLLARPKVKYWGAYLNGFLERARVLLGATIDESIWHLCGGMAKAYPGKRGIGPNDLTFDVRPETKPDVLCDVRELFAIGAAGGFSSHASRANPKPRAILIDRPYTLEDAKEYGTEDSLPNLGLLVRQSLDFLPRGLKVGAIDYLCPSVPNGRELAVIQVLAGVNNRSRVFTVWEHI